MCGDEVAVYIPDGGCDCNYTLRKVQDEQYAGTYELLLNGTRVGDLINIPKDNYVDTCVLATVETAEVPYSGAKVGDPYLDITFVNEPRHIYVPLASIVGGGYTIVDSLPDEGDPKYIYLVDDGAGNYDRYVWDSENSEWINIGGTEIDLTDYYTKEDVDAMINGIMLRFYPIGSLYMSENPTDPGTLFGGTWEQIEDTFLLAAGTSHAAGTTGGEEKVDLSETNLPRISGTVEFRPWHRTNTGTIVGGTTGHFTNDGMVGSASYPNYGDISLTAKNARVTYAFGNSTQSTRKHNNMPPYLAIYVWKRIS